MNLTERADLVVLAASNKRMDARIWNKPDPETVEVRVYLTRQNAGRTEAGYVRIWRELTPEGKMTTKSKLVTEGAGPGSRTAASEAESVYSEYKRLRDAKLAEKKSAPPRQDGGGTIAGAI